jgi:signal transduction histidine kinase
MIPAPDAAAAPSRWGARFPSLGARLVGLFLVLAVAVAVTFMVGMHVVQTGGWHESLRPLVLNYTDTLAAEIGSPPDVDRARVLAQRLPLHIRIEGPQVNWDSADEPPPPPPPPAGEGPFRPARRPVVTLPNGDPLPLVVPAPRPPPHDSSRTPAPEAMPRPGPHVLPHRLGLNTDVDPSQWRVVRRLPDGHRLIFSLADMSHARRAEHIGWATLGMLLLFTAFAYAWVRHMLHPLVALRAGAVRYGQGDFSQPIVPRNRDELGDLAEQINGMAARLHHMLDAKRQLLLAISHELRSPLARARMNAELIDDSGERTALLRDLGEMRDLITDLLESERLADVQAGGHAALHTELATLSDIVHEQCDAQAAAGKVTLQLDDTLPALPLDGARIRLLLRNLVDNALRHGGESGPAPVVSTRGTPASVQLAVRDFGPGMEEAQLQHAAEAFYRADAARLRSTGGVGLGLYLCKLVAKAHGGTLSLRNAHPGLEITVALPIAATPA